MKKSILFMAMMLCVSVAFVSCGDDDTSGGKEPSGKTSLNEPKFKDNSQKIIFVNGPYESLELTASGNFCIKKKNDPKARGSITLDAEKSEYETGTYQVAGNVFTLSNGKAIKVVTNAGQKVTVTFTEGDVSEMYEGELQQPMSDSEALQNLCRTWEIMTTSFSASAKGLNLRKEFTGFDLNEVVAYLQSQGIKINDSFDENQKVKDMTFSEYGTYFIRYENGKQDVGTWKWETKYNVLSYTWDDTSMDKSYEIGKASIAFEGKICYLAIMARAEYDGKMNDIKINVVLRNLE